MTTTGVFRYDSKTNILAIDEDGVDTRRSSYCQRRRCLILAMGIFTISTLVIGLIAGAWDHLHNDDNSTEEDPRQAERYSKAAVAADSPQCAEVGKNILLKGGVAVDAAAAVLICTGVINIHSLSIAGGGVMLVYDRKNKHAEIFDYRERSPAGIGRHTFDKARPISMQGGLAIAVPGELRGLREAWGTYGRLPWREIVQPSIDLARNGFPLGKAVTEGIAMVPILITLLRADPGLSELLLNPDGTVKKAGTLIKNEKYARSLERIRDNPDDLYTGELGRQMLKEIKEMKGVMTEKDLTSFKVSRRKPVVSNFNGMKMYTTPLPAGGVLLTHILNINKGFNYSPKDIADTSKKAVVVHRFIESLKWAYSYRPYLGDPDVGRNDPEMKKAVADLLSTEVAEQHRRKINDDRTYPPSFYANDFIAQQDHGTSQVSVLDEEGNAVAVTDSINYEFGAKYRSMKTGIIYNDELADFFHNASNPGLSRIPPANVPGPNKKPLSSKCPTIMVDDKGDVKIIIGASGGLRIPLSTAWVLMLTQWFGMELGEAIYEPRPQHYFYPNRINNNKIYPLDPDLVKEMLKRGHEVVTNYDFGVVQAVIKSSDGIIHAKSDPRKHGHSSGY